jgi:hypothetical protein
MKTKLTLAVAAVAVLTICNLQPATAQSWNLTQNSNVTSTSGLGTTSSNTNPLRFVTHGSERMRIDVNGNIGINTTSLGASRFIVNGSNPFRVMVNNSTKFIVNSNGGVSVGSSSSGPSNGLYVSGNVGLGTTSPTKRLYVASNGTFTTDNTTSGDAIIASATGDGACWGVNASSVNSTAVNASSTSGIGLNASSSSSFGVNAFSSNTHGTHTVSSQDIGIYAETGNPGPSWAGWFQGDVNVTGTVFKASDKKLKQNIADFTSAMGIINQLQPKEYEYKQDGNLKLMNLPRGKHFGLIAQDVEKVLPNLVKEAKFNTANSASAIAASSGKVQSGAVKGEVIDYKSMDYTELIPIMIKAMQELSAENKELRNQIDELKGVKTASPQSTDAAQSATTKLMLSSASLDQNNPNPFAGAATIRYNLPAGFSAAYIVIRDNSGKTIKQVQLNTAGNGTVNIDASTLTSGTYSYSLVVDGKVIGNKKMIVAH